MLFSHDIEHSLVGVVELVNTAPDSCDEDLLEDLDSLQSFVESHEVSEVGAMTRTDLLAVRALRGRLRAVFAAPTDAEAAELVNALVADCPVTPRLTNHDGYAWHVHYSAPGATLAEHLAVDGGMALAQVIAAGERERLRTCEADGCDQVLVDLSRNRSRRYCDARTCGNRMHVAAYRERRRSTVS
ncbi:MAG TPA: CGNR zinc finger domain-containing protein [Nocardioidaceae bacterium]|nr:CGNR zinc finger domain-containing protein [Nocardioidaceae bacterium]